MRIDKYFKQAVVENILKDTLVPKLKKAREDREAYHSKISEELVPEEIAAIAKREDLKGYLLYVTQISVFPSTEGKYPIDLCTPVVEGEELKRSWTKRKALPISSPLIDKDVYSMLQHWNEKVERADSALRTRRKELECLFLQVRTVKGLKEMVEGIDKFFPKAAQTTPALPIKSYKIEELLK